MGTFVTKLIVFASVAGLQPPTGEVCDRVDLIEVNHFYDAKGQLVLDQLIFYDWCPEKSHYDVRTWRLLKSPIQIPRREHRTGQFVAIWRDGKVLRKVLARSVRESWTQYDPEMVERAFLARDKRRDLQTAIASRPTAGPSRQAPVIQRGSQR